MIPGMTMRPLASIFSVLGPASRTMESFEPTAMILPSRTAMACAMVPTGVFNPKDLSSIVTSFAL